MTRIAIMALEGLEEVVEEVVEDTSVEEIVDQPENEIIEMAETTTELENHDDSIEEAADTAETLTDIHDEMDASLETGGLDETAAAAIGVAVEHMCKRVGFPPNRNGFALEAFKSKASRIQATKIAMENIAERAKQLWAAIVAMFWKAVEMVKQFFIRLFDGAAKLAHRGEATIAAAKAKAGKAAPADAKVSGAAMSKYLRNGNMIVSGDDLVTAYTKFTGNNPSLNAQFYALGASDAMVKLFEAVNSNDKFDELLEKQFSEHNYGEKATGKEVVVEGMDVYEDKFGLGDMAVYYTLIPSGTPAGNIKPLLGKMGSKVAKVSGYTEIEKAEFPPMNADTATKLASVVKEAMDGYSKIKADIVKIETSQKNVATKAKAMSGKDTPTDAANNVSSVQACSRYVISVTTTLLAQTRSHDINVAKAALDYCSASLAKIGKEEKAPEAKAEDKDKKAA
jgi:hypothetical protein